MILNGNGIEVGGIAGANSGKISKCYNKANIYGKLPNGTNKEVFVGGITSIANSNCVIENCYNTGNISATNNITTIGGITNDSWQGTNITIRNCYNIGTLSGKYVGGIRGRDTATVTITNCYTTVNANYNANSVTADTLKTYASVLGDAYTNDDGRNNGYPILKWELEKR